MYLTLIFNKLITIDSYLQSLPFICLILLLLLEAYKTIIFLEIIISKYNILFPKSHNKIMGSKQRIIEYLTLMGIGKREFSRDTGVSHTILNSGKNLGTDKLEKIISAYPEINLYWIVSGVGKKIINEEEQKIFGLNNKKSSNTNLNSDFKLNFIKAISSDEDSREILTLFVKTIFNQMYSVNMAELLMDKELAKELINNLTKSLKNSEIEI